ncbi:MAG: UDP-glucose 4-epimerase [Frankiales bacterium]|jgi:UDP-glucose 4-epimerase|nr:UDP-glucose 4-epimerase [Frankiales bacterium]
MSWLVTGGAGYIGAHVVRAMVEDGQQVVALDDLSTGDRLRVHDGARFVEGSVLDRDVLRRALQGVTGVVHVAAKKQVGESVAEPLWYYRENLDGLLTLLEECRSAGVDKFVFSSSAATYGMPDVAYVTEDISTAPLSPYGETKLVGEWLLKDCTTAFGLQVMNMRYFNVAGAASPELGDPGVFNLVPLIFQALQKGERPRVFGGDYPTPDGTCLRDYVHVADIADAHLAAARALDAGQPGATYNIGRGEGSSVLEVLDMVHGVTGLDCSYDVVARRPGDPARIVASVDRIREGLGFRATYDLRQMVESAWAGWQLRQQ